MPLTKKQTKDYFISQIRDLDSESLTQVDIASKLRCSQQLVSYYLKKIREQDRLELERAQEELAYTYRVTLDNLRKIRKELWSDLRQTTDKRTKASFYHELQEVNLKIIELASSNDIILATVKNAERIAQEAKKDLQKARAKVDTSVQDTEQELEVELEVAEGSKDYEDIPIAEDDNSDSSSSGDEEREEEVVEREAEQQASVTSAAHHDDGEEIEEQQQVVVDSASYGGNGACMWL